MSQDAEPVPEMVISGMGQGFCSHLGMDWGGGKMPELLLLSVFLGGIWVCQGVDQNSVQKSGLDHKCQDEELGLCPKGTEEPWRVCEQEQCMTDLGPVKGQSGGPHKEGWGSLIEAEI